MDVLLNAIRKADGRLLVFAVITIFAVGFSVYQAVDALSGHDASPAYRRSPPSAFAIPIVDTIVDPQRLTAPRLPDQAYLEISKETNDLSKKVASQTLSVANLTALGMSSAKAEAVLAQVQAYYGTYSGRNAQTSGGANLGSVTQDAAETTQTVVFSQGNGGSASGAFTLDYQFAFSNGQWVLTSLLANF